MDSKHAPVAEALVEFRWDVPVQAHQLVTRTLPRARVKSNAKKTSEPKTKVVQESPRQELKPLKMTFVVEADPIGTEIQVSRYNPLTFNPISKSDVKISDHRPRLYRDFCELKVSAKTVLEFADACGLLVGSDLEAPGKGTAVVRGEPVSLWMREVADMKLAFDLWNAVLEKDNEFLKRHIKFCETEGSLVVECTRGVRDGGGGTSFSRATVVNAKARLTERVQFLKNGDYRLAAVFAVQDLITKRLVDHVGASMLYRPDRDPRDGKEAVTLGRARLPLGLRMVPKTLLGALWLQLAQDIEQGVEHRRCVLCSKRMEISLEASRVSRQTCSYSCRKMLHERRKGEARVLRADGKTPREIADALKISVAQARKWSQPKRPRGRPRKRNLVDQGRRDLRGE